MEFKDAQNHASFQKRRVRENEASKTRQWFLVMIVFGGLLALGNLAFSQYDSIWVSAIFWSPKEYWTRGRTTRPFQVKESSLGEPWSQVSYFPFGASLLKDFDLGYYYRRIIHEETS